jgi:DNA-binding IclR family transcriptional regulator
MGPSEKAVLGRSQLDEDANSDRVYAVERALLLLQCFETTGESRSLSSLAQRSGLYKSTILRLAGSLCRMGFLERDPQGFFSLGPELRRLGSLTQASVDVRKLMRPVLGNLAAATQETASFYVRDGRHRICLFRENSPKTVRHHLEEGGRHPLDVGAPGKILRAYSKHAKDPELLAIRRRGWATSRGERDPDLASLAVPVFNKYQELLGALSVSAVLSRFTKEQQQHARTALLTAAEMLSAKMRFLSARDLLRTSDES